MPLSVHSRSMLQMATALANSHLDGETLATEADVRTFAQVHAFSHPIRVTPDDAEDLRELRTRLRGALLPPETDDPGAADASARAAELVNEIFRRTRTLPQLRKHDQWDWHIHAVPNDAGVAVRTAADLAIAIADLLIDGEISRFGACAAADCDALFVDLTRNRSKRFCDRGNCGNRTHVAAYRARRAEEPRTD